MADMAERVRTVINDEVRPALQASGGDVEFVALDGGVVSLRLSGPCGSCPSTSFAILMDIERQLRDRVPEVEYVETAR